jgi:pre-60S factor REI1
MSSQHSLFIPSPSQLYSLESFLSYLAVLIFEYHECLYCGQEKGSVNAVQTHMRDKGHCMIAMDGLDEFWDVDELAEDEIEESREGELGSESLRVSLGVKTRLPSGVVVKSRHGNDSGDAVSKPIQKPRFRRRVSTHRKPKPASDAASAPTPISHATNPQHGHLAMHHHNSSDTHRNLSIISPTVRGLTGVSNQKIRTLQIQEKRMKSREESTKAKGRFAAQQQPVKCVYYKTENPVYQAG